jgi:hypothetical protein
MSKGDKGEFYYENGSFGPGDAEYWYHIIRQFKPQRIIEIGSGYSTLMAVRAIQRNRDEQLEYSVNYMCLEPYPWLNGIQAIKEIQVVPKRVEEVDPSMFKSLEANDVLFIDSSHVIRAQGDVEFEILRILPRLRQGVFVHIHDVFTPKDYLFDWKRDDRNIFFNEQYLLEAFLSFNSQYKIVGAVNYLSHHYPERLYEKCPVLASNQTRWKPASFWLQRA